nr:M20 aminoacylase family protein [uncultured Cohaesibacter sp.]
MDQSNDFASLSDFEDKKAEMAANRQHIHQNPELSHEESQTSAFVAGKLKDWGYEVAENVGGHGVVARMKVGEGSKSIAIRADMDALPITEETGLAYASQNEGVMHACGHDGHTAVLLGTAEYLARTKKFNGTVNLIFQPAEESPVKSGAERMIEDGLLERFPFDCIYGLHNHPGAPVGQIMLRDGPAMAGADMIDITVRGKGGHGARPQETIDPVVTACHIAIGLQTIVSRNIDPFQPAVLTIGAIHGGKAPNVIPEEVLMRVTLRTFDQTVRDHAKKRIIEMSKSIAEGFGATAEVVIPHGLPVVVNSTAEMEFAKEVALELVGEEGIAEFPISSGSEDFAHYLAHKPGCFIRVGNGEGSAALHNPKFNFSDDLLPVGAALWARLVERYLQA